MSQLKFSITEKTARFNQKHLDAISVSSYSNYVLASNKSFQQIVAAAEANDRRLMILEVKTHIMSFYIPMSV